jgi:hypothetical protein
MKYVRNFLDSENIVAGVRMNGIHDEKKLYLGNYLSYTYPIYVIKKDWSESLFSGSTYVHAPPHFCHRFRNHLDRETAGRFIADVDQSLGLLGRQI